VAAAILEALSLRALRFDGQHVSLATDQRPPTIEAGEALVRPLLSGICSSDLELSRGTSNFVGTLGHEFVGVVESARVPSEEEARRTGIGHMLGVMRQRAELVGKRVVAGINVVCLKCDLCRSGLSSHCRQRSVLGISGRDGAFADQVAVPLVNLHEVPANVSDEEAVFAEPLASAIHATQVAKIEGKPYVTVLGDGKLGLLVVQVLVKMNASVRLLGKHPEKYGLCDHFGIKHRHIDEVGRRQDQDVVVDCTGSAAGLAMAMSLVRPRGKIIIKSSISPVPIPTGAPVPGADHPAWREPINLAPIVLNEIQVIGSRCGHIPDALAMLASKQVQVVPLITKRGKLEDGVQLLEVARKGQIKVVMEHRRAG
jgi:alcohol dehydrogenase